MIAQGCHKWSCPVCAPRRKARLVYKIRDASPNRFLTLTCRHEGKPEDQLSTITKALPKTINELRKRHGSIEYLRMLERCADGYPHFHLLIRSGYLPQPDIKAIWERRTGAWIVDIRKAHGRSIGYVAKYVQKALGDLGTWMRQRMSVSQHFWVQQPKPEQQFINCVRKQHHPITLAETHLRDYEIDRVAIGLYHIGDENPNRCLPEELDSHKVWEHLNEPEPPF